MGLMERVMRRVAKREDGCWEWCGALHHGYGWINDKNGDGKWKPTTAHRVAWESANGPIPRGMYVLHRCDNRRCVNPEHLFLGTHLENLADMRQKGRGAKGEMVGGVKLSERDVITIRHRYSGGESQRHLASEFGVHQSTVSLLVSKRNWAHVE